MTLLYSLLAVIAGAALMIRIPLSNGVTEVSSPIWASAASFVIGAVVMVATLLVMKHPLPSMQSLSTVPPYAWLSGVAGALYVTLAILIGPKIGAVNLVALVIVGQFITSILVDHYGLAGYAQQELNLGRIAGAILLIAGVVLIKRF